MKQLFAKDTGVNWYQRSEMTIGGKVYTILDVEWDSLMSRWLLTVK